MALPDWVVIGGIASGVIAAATSLLRFPSDKRKANRDGTAAMMTSAGAMVASVHEEMSELRREVGELRTRQRRQETLWRAHSRWDDQIVTKLSAAGITVPDPPPLFDAADGVQ